MFYSVITVVSTVSGGCWLFGCFLLFFWEYQFVGDVAVFTPGPAGVNFFCRV